MIVSVKGCLISLISNIKDLNQHSIVKQHRIISTAVIMYTTQMCVPTTHGQRSCDADESSFSTLIKLMFKMN